MSYFTAKAREHFQKIGGDPDNTDALAYWAEAMHAEGDTKTGVVIAKDGQIMATTVLQDGETKTRYIATVNDMQWSHLRNVEVGLATAEIESISGKQCVHVSYWEVCSGQSPIKGA